VQGKITTLIISSKTMVNSSSGVKKTSTTTTTRAKTKKNNILCLLLLLVRHDDRTTTAAFSPLSGHRKECIPTPLPNNWNCRLRRRRCSRRTRDPIFTSVLKVSIVDTVDDSSTDERLRATQWIEKFSTALSSGDVTAAIDLFAPDDENQDYDASNDKEEGYKNPSSTTPFWRDMIAYTWNIVTLEGRATIQAALRSIMDVEKTKTNHSSSQPPTTTSTSWKLDEPSCSSSSGSSSPSSSSSSTTAFPPPLVVRSDGGCEFWCDIQTTVGTGRAHVRLNANQQATTVLTVLLELFDRPFAVGPTHRKRGYTHGPQFGRRYWSERRPRRHLPKEKQQQQQHGENNSNNNNDDAEEEEEEEEESYYVAIVGGGQAGLTLAARLEVLDVPYVVVEAGSTPGWSWRDNRYPSLHLHDPVWYQHLPFLPFPSSWPIFTPKDKLADWLDMYAKVMDIHIQTNTKVVRATRENNNNQAGQEQEKEKVVSSSWTLTLEQAVKEKEGSETNSQGRIQTRTIHAKHLVFATGNSSFRKVPTFPGADMFKGIQLHSSNYQGGRAFAGKRVVVIGSNNSGFDMVQDLWEQGAASVTMIQRTPSLVVSTKSVLDHGLGPLYSEHAPFHHEDADLIATTVPYKLLIRDKWPQVTQTMKETDAELIQGLERVGYQFDYGFQGTGLFAKSATEGGGFYINVGCAELFVRGHVCVRYATVERLESEGVIIRDKITQREETLPADAIVYATGFATMDAWVERLCGSDVAQQVGRTWGLGLNHNARKDPGPWEGELRNMWKPTNVEGCWFHGGNLAQCRHYSRFLALQLAARYLDLVDTESAVYGIPKAVPPSD
jgi:putative flavoprotein involved in K+ transport